MLLSIGTNGNDLIGESKIRKYRDSRFSFSLSYIFINIFIYAYIYLNIYIDGSVVIFVERISRYSTDWVEYWKVHLIYATSVEIVLERCGDWVMAHARDQEAIGICHNKIAFKIIIFRCIRISLERTERVFFAKRSEFIRFILFLIILSQRWHDSFFDDNINIIMNNALIECNGICKLSIWLHNWLWTKMKISHLMRSSRRTEQRWNNGKLWPGKRHVSDRLACYIKSISKWWQIWNDNNSSCN